MNRPIVLALLVSSVVVLAPACSQDSQVPAGADAGPRRRDAAHVEECETMTCGDECCAPGEVCAYGTTCCMPSCGYMRCGDDGCGGSCGTCATGFACQGGQCQQCQPNCLGKQCGNNGCGGSCAQCPSGFFCNAQFSCQPNTQPGPDAGYGSDASVPGTDGGWGGPDAGEAADGGVAQPVNTRVPFINNTAAPGHPAPGATVHFKAVVVSPRWQISKSTTSTDPTQWSCLYGVFVADATAPVEHNGLLLTSKATVDPTTKACRTDSQVHPTGGAPELAIGEELEVTGYYLEYCGNTQDKGVTCLDVDSLGREIRFPEITASRAGDVVRTGRFLGMPSGLPVMASVDEVSSTGVASPYALGSRWWQLRSVLVALTYVYPVDLNPDLPAGKDYCEWAVAPYGLTTPRVRVDDAINFGGTTCVHRPVDQMTVYTTLNGFLYWSYGNSKLLPRDSYDSVPPMP